MTGLELSGGGISILALAGLVIRGLGKKQGVASCMREHKHIESKFKSGNERFNKLERADINIMEKLSEHGETMVRMEGTLGAIAKANNVSSD